MRARERILEAAGGLVATLESSVGHKDGKGINDLEVIQEERETKTDSSNTLESVEGDEEEVTGEELDRGMIGVSTSRDKEAAKSDAGDKTKQEDSEASSPLGKAEEEDGSDKLPVKDDVTTEDLVTSEEPDPGLEQEGSKGDDIFPEPATPSGDKGDAESSSEVTDPFAAEEPEGLSPLVDLNTDN